MKHIESNQLDTVTGGMLAKLATANTTNTVSRAPSATGDAGLQTALAGVTSALDSLKQNGSKSTLDQLLPAAIMARWIRQNG